MKKAIEWIKQNKIFLLLLIAFLYIVFPNLIVSRYRSSGFTASAPSSFGGASMGNLAMGKAVSSVSYDQAVAEEAIMPPIPDEVAPSDSDDRIIIQDTSLSMQVKDVAQSISKIQDIAIQNGGFLVSSNFNKPEAASSGTITIRVNADSRTDALSQIKALAVKVVNQTVSGRDVTDQYADLDERLRVLNTTKAKFEAILDQAEEVEDLLKVQRELVNLQSQIDSVVGRQQFLEKSAQLTKISVYLSTDELALPYSPDKSWRPQVVFKQAVRSLVQTFRDIANSGIWIGVYSVILIPAGIILWLIVKFLKRRP